MTPYRTQAIRPPEPPPTPFPFFCRKGYHRPTDTKILCGWEGPDNARAYIICRGCQSTGIRWCDGDISWTEGFAHEQRHTSATTFLKHVPKNFWLALTTFVLNAIELALNLLHR